MPLREFLDWVHQKGEDPPKMCVLILLANTEQKEEGILRGVHSPLPFDCVCKVIRCLESLLPQFPCHGRLYPQTVSQNKPLLP